MRSRPLGPQFDLLCCRALFYDVCFENFGFEPERDEAEGDVVAEHPDTVGPGPRATGHITVCDFGHMYVFGARHETPDYMTLPFLSLLPHLNGDRGEAVETAGACHGYPIIICDRILWLDGFYELCEDL